MNNIYLKYLVLINIIMVICIKIVEPLYSGRELFLYELTDDIFIMCNIVIVVFFVNDTIINKLKVKK